MKIFILFILILNYSHNILAKDTLKVACVGNSVTYGYTVPNREQNAYPSQLQKLLGNKYLVGNFGHSGATLLKKGHRPYNNLPEYKAALQFAADYVIIHLGLNDTDPRNWPNYRNEFLHNYIDLIDAFRKNNPKVKIWICKLSPITYKHKRFDSGTRDWYRQIQKKIEQVAEVAKVELIDLQENLYSRPDLLPDALHPNAEGAGIIAKQVYSAISGDYGDLQMPEVYSDNMVLQRNINLEIKGTANANEQVRVEIAGQQLSTKAADNGKWRLTLAPLKAATNLVLKISTKNTIFEYKNVAVGEVWLCSGQSNMEFKLKQSAEHKYAKLNNSNIRLFDMRAHWLTDATEWEISALDSVNKLNYYKKASWQISNEKTAMEFSAIAYYFGEMLADSLNITIGLIHNSVGGSTTESWIDRNTLELHLSGIYNDWVNNDLVMPWVRSRGFLNTKKSENKNQRHPYHPSYLFEAGIKPLANYPIKGVVWYQGESNAHNVELHEKLFRMLQQSWRRNWDKQFLPIHFVQLSSIERPSWGHFRDSQRKLAEESLYNYMTVSSDLGDSLDVHPRHKKEIGQRLASSALHYNYNKPNVVPTGPSFKSMSREKSKLILEFHHAKELRVNGDKLVGFEIAGKDELYKDVTQVEINASRLTLSSTEVNEPHFVRYAYKAYTRANLVNEAGFPASTFQSKLTNKKNRSMKIEVLENYPVKGGVSATFTGVHNNKLIVAGGCNFVVKNSVPVRAFYKDIYCLDVSDVEERKWKKLKDYPNEIAYGASVNTPEGIVCIGGNTEKGASKKVYILSYNEAKGDVEIKSLPDLEFAVSNAAASLVGRIIYLAGGAIKDGVNNGVFTLDLDKPDAWKHIHTPFEAECQQAAMFFQGDRLFFTGGYNEVNAKVFTEILTFDFDKKQWMPFSQLILHDKPQAMIGGSALVYGNDEVLFVSGVNYNVFRAALERIQKTQQAEKSTDKKLLDELKQAGKEYMSQQPEWYEFRTEILKLNLADKKMEVIGNFPDLARAGAGITLYNNRLYIVGGELKPGVRTEKANYIDLK